METTGINAIVKDPGMETIGWYKRPQAIALGAKNVRTVKSKLTDKDQQARRVSPTRNTLW
jgi:hypothetical protein